jgi:hypothetical protein
MKVKLVSFGLEIGLKVSSSSSHGSRNIREKVALFGLVPPARRDSSVSNQMTSFGFSENLPLVLATPVTAGPVSHDCDSH